MNQEPYVCVPNKNSSSKCDWCFSSSNIKKCSACQVVWYCSSSCQVYIYIDLFLFEGFSGNNVCEIDRIWYEDE